MFRKVRLFYITFIYLLLISFIFINTDLFLRDEKKTNISLNETSEIFNENNDNLEIVNDYKKKYNNDEVTGVISILNTTFEKAIMQSNNNEYYLDHLENKKSHYKGSIYLDFRVNIDDDKKLLIYGHNSANVSMPFKILEKYYSKSYYQEHQYIEIITSKKTRLYKVFSVYVETKDFDYMQTEYDNSQVWINHLNKLKDKSLYDTEVTILPTDNILILQTCSTHKDYKKYQKKYLLVVAKEII